MMLGQCKEDDGLARVGVWRESAQRKLEIGRKKFVVIGVLNDFLKL